jgi:hypothetical protein
VSKKGNRYIYWSRAYSLSSIGKLLERVSTPLAIYGAIDSYQAMISTDNVNEQVEPMLDLLFTGTGLIPVGKPVPQIISASWTFGGKRIVFFYASHAIRTEQELGIVGLPFVMPFK